MCEEGDEIGYESGSCVVLQREIGFDSFGCFYLFIDHVLVEYILSFSFPSSFFLSRGGMDKKERKNENEP